MNLITWPKVSAGILKHSNINQNCTADMTHFYRFIVARFISLEEIKKFWGSYIQMQRCYKILYGSYPRYFSLPLSLSLSLSLSLPLFLLSFLPLLLEESLSLARVHLYAVNVRGLHLQL